MLRRVSRCPNVQFAIKAGDRPCKTFTTDGEGRFQVALPPGHYVILREDAGPRMAAGVSRLMSSPAR